jgi:hypothetical protein
MGLKDGLSRRKVDLVDVGCEMKLLWMMPEMPSLSFLWRRGAYRYAIHDTRADARRTFFKRACEDTSFLTRFVLRTILLANTGEGVPYLV